MQARELQGIPPVQQASQQDHAHGKQDEGEQGPAVGGTEHRSQLMSLSRPNQSIA